MLFYQFKFSFSIVSFIAIDIAQSAGDNHASTQFCDTVLYYLGWFFSDKDPLALTAANP
jgi:hypothetical protein